MADPYLYPGTGILRNNEGIRDAAALEQFERLMTRQRLEEPPPAVAISAAGFCTLHRHLFQDVYDWAGQYRTVDLAKSQSYFCRAEFIGRELDKRFAALRGETDLKGLTPEAFAARAAEHITELNAIHPFREGNGRALRAFLEVLTANAGHGVDLTRIMPAAWHDASVRGFMHGDHEAMRHLIAGALIDAGVSS